MGKKRGRRRRRSTRGNALKEVRALKKSLEKNKEYKVFDFQQNVTFTNEGEILWLTPIAGGIDFNERIGNECRLKSINFRYHKMLGEDAGLWTKILMFRDNNSQGALPTVADLIGGANWLNPPLWENRDRFTILFDRFVNNENETPRDSIIKYYKRFNTKMLFNSATATQADAESGQIYILFIANLDGIADTGSYTVRFVFTET